MIQPPKNHEYKKVSGQILDPFKDVRGNNIFNNIDIADTVASPEKESFNALAYQSRLHAASQRHDKEIKPSLKEIS